ncbi:MAG: hypothetical protein IJB43_02070, partial [Clostridia bacterium]|nr:hypothetical protein [Clostridia bacterium]
LKSNHFVSTYYSQHKRNHCVILKVHSDFPFSYIFSFWCSADHFASTALPEEQLDQREILRAQAVCGRALRMTSFFLAGASPLHPIYMFEHSFLLFVHIAP